MTRANPAVIGGFILGALALTVLTVLVVGSGALFQNTFRCVMYFEGAVQGLQVGASVNFRGVKVGTVKAVKMAFDPKNLDIRIPVFVEFPRGYKGEMEMMEMRDAGPRTPQDALDALIKRGLRAQLQTESLVTGQLFIQLDFHPYATPPQTLIDPDTKLLEIPTVPTTLQEISQTLREALHQLAALPLREMVFDLQKTLQGIEHLVNAPELMALLHHLTLTAQEAQRFLSQAGGNLEQVATAAAATLGHVDGLATEAQPLLRDTTALVRNTDKQLERVLSGAVAALGSIGKLAQRTDTQVQALGHSVSTTSTAAVHALEQARDTLSALQNMVAPNAPVGYELAKTLRELSDTARSLRLLADYLERYPNSLLFGKKEGNSK